MRKFRTEGSTIALKSYLVLDNKYLSHFLTPYGKYYISYSHHVHGLKPSLWYCPFEAFRVIPKIFLRLMKVIYMYLNYYLLLRARRSTRGYAPGRLCTTFVTEWMALWEYDLQL